MIDISPVTLWGLIVLLGIGTFLIRYSFLGLIGDRELPEWLLRHLRYTSVAVFPALIAPLVVWPAATGGEAEPARISAAVVTLAVGVLSRNVLLSIICGIATLYGMLALLG
ncbi:AzlD branched-chain amino acid transport [Dinoroseobacter shibae DFL 12 = DSM 16493]|jgi:branched-subunit amino acid transport protein|uniref:AzlD branched-chain amino acid transport n=1 Tax=Dinoroseobacter shibae (strain DSM 16493 / NCIMB 14021 / DFL 12) TaxID=398580 RepID=A8LL63_DINSH|nr:MULTISPECIES: AzlD domain-containing protein [Dinoroseobacter]ABV94812.1 AzlD branched-chain amino acid transport [Dinoroseobacter shibae DFL 12 = DSM 16493]MDD9716744.1 AzlD domain-containing protein [Dinoroseobacter sp. PD6]URF46232.1 AzlD domain-containing protein [Dinoroseobacter shibae]URF50539.1 AzlD domain-containing protein [Dinoroseobacter shibae]